MPHEHAPRLRFGVIQSRCEPLRISTLMIDMFVKAVRVLEIWATNIAKLLLWLRRQLVPDECTVGCY